MQIFISYHDSALAAENEFLKLFKWLGNSSNDRLPLAGTLAEGWSRMLPGLVWDLCPEIPDEKSPAMFIALLNDRSLISCELQGSPALVSKPKITQILKEQDRRYNIGGLAGAPDSNRLNFLSKVVDGTVSIRPVPEGPALPNLYLCGGAEAGSGFADRSQDSTIASIMAVAAGYAEQSSLSVRMTDLLIFLFSASEGSNTATLRKLTRDFNCRFAWSSIQLDDFARSQSSPLGPAADFAAVPIPANQDNGNMRMLKSFWEKRTSFMRPFALAPRLYSSLVEHGRPLSWPPWFQFLIFVSKAGRRANAKLRTYRIPKLLKFRRRGNRNAGPSGHRPAPADDPFATKTLAQLFRGIDGTLPVGPELRRRTMRLVRQKGLLLQIERSLYIPDTDTFYSLYRGFCPVRATTRKRNGNA